MIVTRIFIFLTILILSVQDLFGQEQTWSGDIACIIYNNCVTCHHENGIAPFSLMTYEDASQRAALIAHVVEERIMPPWPPDPDHNRFLNQRVLSEEEKEAISSWAELGAPSGDLALAPSPPVLESEEVIEDPDLVVQLPEYTSQASSRLANVDDDFRCFVIPSEIYEDLFITEVEFVPGNDKIVHHAGIFLDDSGQPRLLDENDPAPGYSCFGGIGSTNFRMVGGWAPGMPPLQFPEGMGMSLPANSDIVVQLHYPVGSQGEVDQSKVNFKLSDRSDLREITISSALNDVEGLPEPLFIPANTMQSFEVEIRMNENVTILGVAPHMHLVGRSIRAYAIHGDIYDTISLVNVPDWNFDWQGFYDYKKPLIIPARAMLHAEATYDNTVSNPRNPSFPPKDIFAGQESTDEMMIVSLLWVSYSPGDEDLVFSDTPPQGSPDCERAVVSVEESDFEPMQISIFPNPVQQASHILVRLSGADHSGKLNYVISDLTGKSILDGRLAKTKTQYLDLPETMNSGVYLISIYSENASRIYLERIVVD